MSCSCRVLECAICTTSYTRSMVIKTATPEELMQNERVKKLVEALRNIKSTSKKDLTENPGYWGEMIVGEAMQALKKFEVRK